MIRAVTFTLIASFGFSAFALGQSPQLNLPEFHVSFAAAQLSRLTLSGCICSQTGGAVGTGGRQGRAGQ